ncbi:hypothetical protein TTHERM_00196260 (macronuclear) [Tetrahymena thermophila SB210]|uniref:Uncharacterized protein n=1 Tax=Tetrahymena thermophila (strain SB210) TaxID=312017 RepID=Q23K08_TETTS|nr:hypothetical protein TTHERM_00196260 [Tetrahymena thermophila SB210]EAR97035.1 hypothetical protein TTHERM_00196260 [Tetrahymena thermophila SB210]|eukprot:XP_001017280.1 hypothetical protein TTHERM_00196260 [Tetrahymena thermophila SB210]
MIKNSQGQKKRVDAKSQITTYRESKEKEKEIPIANLKSGEELYNEEQITKSQNRVAFIQKQFDDMGMTNPFKINSLNLEKAFSVQDIIKTIIEIFTDAIECSKPSKFNIINYFVNYVYQKVESKTLTSQFCWSLIDQIGKEAVTSNEMRIILSLIEESSYDQIKFYINFRKMIFQYLFNLEKNKCGYESFQLDDYNVICEQWVRINQRYFEFVSYEQIMQYFEEEIKKIKFNFDQDLFYKLQCSEFMFIGLLFNKHLTSKYGKYEEHIEKYRKQQSAKGYQYNLQAQKKHRQECSDFLIKWGWSTFNQQLETKKQIQQNLQVRQNYNYEQQKPQTVKKQPPRSRKSIIITQDRSKSANNLKNNQLKQQYPSFNDDSISKTPEKRKVSNASRKVSITNTAPSFKQQQFTSPNSFDNQKDTFFTPNRTVSPFSDQKQSHSQTNFQNNQKIHQFNKTTNQFYYQQQSNQKSFF